MISTHTSEDTPSKVFFSSGDHAQDTFLSSLRGSTQVVKYDSESGFVILASIADEDEEVVLPITLSFIPISSKSQHATHASLSATLRAFASLLPPSTEDEREIVLYHKRLGVISCVSVPSSISSELINLRVSSSGDQVVLAPLYTLPSKEEHIEKEDPWKVSYLTPHGPVKVLSQTPEEKVKEPPSSLLTPPPSPSFRHSFRMPEIETVLESQSQSFEIPQEAAETPEVQDHDASDDVGMAVPDAVESSTEDTPSNVTVEELSVDDIDDEIAPREPAPPLSASSISGHITSIVVRVVQEADKRVGLRAARSMFPCRSAFRFLLDFSVHVLFTRLFGALGFVLAFIGWRKHDLRIRGTKEPQSERIQEVMEVMEVPDDADETTPITENPPEQPAEAQVEAEEEMVSSSSIAEESISASDDAREDAQSEATVVEDDIEKHIPDPSSPELPGAFGPDDTPEGELLPPRLSTRLHTKLAALLLRSPFSSPDSPPTEITITLNGKPVSALYHKIASQDRGVPFHLFEFTASTNGGNVEVSSE